MRKQHRVSSKQNRRPVIHSYLFDTTAMANLEFIAADHVDDILCAGPEHILKEFMAALYKVFGADTLEVTWTNFKCCGVKHTKLDDGYSMDQIEYCSGLRTVENSQVTGQPASQLADPQNASSFLSVLMAVAYTIITRPDIAVHVVALQRRAKSPTYGNIKDLNTVVKWVKKHPLQLV